MLIPHQLPLHHRNARFAAGLMPGVFRAFAIIILGSLAVLVRICVAILKHPLALCLIFETTELAWFI
jgi:hypothetical protein